MDVGDRRDQVADDTVRCESGEQVPPLVREQRREQSQVGEVNVVTPGIEHDNRAVAVDAGFQF